MALITNVTGAHLEGFGSVGRHRPRQGGNLHRLRRRRHRRDQRRRQLRGLLHRPGRAAGLNIVTVGREQGDLHADAVRLDDHGCDFVLQPLGLTLRLPLVGAHQISNALMALGAVQALGA